MRTIVTAEGETKTEGLDWQDRILAVREGLITTRLPPALCPLRGASVSLRRPNCSFGRSLSNGFLIQIPLTIDNQKGPPIRAALFDYGGEGGIRTLDTFPYTHFPGVRLRPLGHLTVRARMLPHGEAISSPREAGNQRHGYCLLSLGRGLAAASVLRKGLMSIPPRRV